MSITEEAARTLADHAVRAEENLLVQAVTDRLGSGWVLENLRGRLCRLIYPDGNETFTLDGKPLFDLTPIEFSQEDQGGRILLHATRSYRKRAP